MGAASCAALLVTAFALGAGFASVASSESTPTTVVIGDGLRPTAATGPFVNAARSAIASWWPDAVITGVTEVRHGGADYTDVAGARADGSSFVMSVYRHFEVKELEAAGLQRMVHAEGTLWVGATDDDLTSVYFQGKDGTSVWLGITPARGAKAPSVATVSNDARTLAALPEIADLGRAAEDHR